jgi:TolB protein
LPTRIRIWLLLSLASLPMVAQRDPVLKQIDLPHSYYYREMYLPQLTTGPSAVAAGFAQPRVLDGRITLAAEA